MIIETAIAIPVMMLLFTAVVGLGFYIKEKAALTTAVGSASINVSRFAAVPGESMDTVKESMNTQIALALGKESSDLSSQGITVEEVKELRPDDNSGRRALQVSVSKQVGSSLSGGGAFGRVFPNATVSLTVPMLGCAGDASRTCCADLSDPSAFCLAPAIYSPPDGGGNDASFEAPDNPHGNSDDIAEEGGNFFLASENSAGNFGFW